MDDTYLTVGAPSKGEYSEKGSKFLAFAFHVETADEVHALVQSHRKEYYDARHVCYAYMLGFRRETYRAVDDGEPSGTAGKPILGQINSNSLTDTLIIVVRYFGGTKLGTSGLIQAYKTAAADAIHSARIEERTVDDTITMTFEYPLLSQVMRIIKDYEPTILRQDFQMDCTLTVRIRKASTEGLLAKLRVIRGVSLSVGAQDTQARAQ